MTVSRISLTAQGPELSRIVYGWWRCVEWGLDSQGILGHIEACLERGITTFDHADIYGAYQCERLFGEALALKPSLRDSMELVTKCGIKLLAPHGPARRVKHYDTGKAHIAASVDNSLKNLGVEYVDLLLIHRPDPFMDPDDTAAGLAAVRKAGKVRHVGVSNFTPRQYALLASRVDFPLVTNQIEFSVLEFEPLHDGTLDLCQQYLTNPRKASTAQDSTLTVLRANFSPRGVAGHPQAAPATLALWLPPLGEHSHSQVEELPFTHPFLV